MSLHVETFNNLEDVIEYCDDLSDISSYLENNLIDNQMT